MKCSSGERWRPPSLGVHPARVKGREGVAATVFAPDATGVKLCLFDEDDRELRVLDLERDEDLWRGFVADAGVGQRYGLRADGPWAPAEGHRFNPARLLIDPWALSLSGSVERLALQSGHRIDAPLLADPQDNAHRVPKARVIDARAELARGASITPGPHHALADTLIYELQVRAATALHPQVAPGERGSYRAVASPPMLDHYRRMGITTLCLLPVHQHIDERHLLGLGLRNHWGYNTLSYFVPHRAYASAGAGDAQRDDAGVREEFREMVDTLHRHGIEVILDVVYNHTAEGDALGPMLHWRGLANRRFYALDVQGGYLQPSGCGNSPDFGEPRVTQLVMDSLRWWVQAYGVDGFRFDLAVTLGREGWRGGGFDARAGFFQALRQDPVLAGVKWIAEPWDLGADGYRLGQMGPGWVEWNDRFRDDVRAWWLGHPCTPGAIANRLAGSSDVFSSTRSGPLAGINFITAHDGFTLADLTAYSCKHNQANGEDNRDGHNHNLSANAGHEGPSNDPRVLQRRARWRRALLSTLFVSQGVPQLLAGDEMSHSQRGNNNAYCQDNDITWLDWAVADDELSNFVQGLAVLRRRYPALRRTQWLRDVDVRWRRGDGSEPDTGFWNDPSERFLACFFTPTDDSGADYGGREPAQAPPSSTAIDAPIFLLLHASELDRPVSLPPGRWCVVLDSAAGVIEAEGSADPDAALEPHIGAAPGPRAKRYVEGEFIAHGPTVMLMERVP